MNRTEVIHRKFRIRFDDMSLLILMFLSLSECAGRLVRNCVVARDVYERNA